MRIILHNVFRKCLNTQNLLVHIKPFPNVGNDVLNGVSCYFAAKRITKFIRIADHQLKKIYKSRLINENLNLEFSYLSLKINFNSFVVQLNICPQLSLFVLSCSVFDI